MGKTQDGFPAVDLEVFPLIDHEGLVPVIEPGDILQPYKVHRDGAANETMSSLSHLAIKSHFILPFAA